MAEEDDAADAGTETTHPNTPTQLRAARDDAKTARLDRDRYRSELTALRSEYTKARNTWDSETEVLKAAQATEIEKVRIDLTGRATAAETQAQQVTVTARNRVMMADLRIAAREAGMLDLDGLKLLDTEAVKLGEDGDVTNAADLMAAMREAKPYLFGQAPKPGTVTGTTAPAALPPRSAPPAGFNALTASREEYLARLADATRPRAG